MERNAKKTDLSCGGNSGLVCHYSSMIAVVIVVVAILGDLVRNLFEIPPF